MADIQENSSPRSIHSNDSSTSRVPETPGTQRASYTTDTETFIANSTESATLNVQDSQDADIISAPKDFQIILNTINSLSSQVTCMQKTLSAKVDELNSKVDKLHKGLLEIKDSKALVGQVTGLLDIQGQLIHNLSTSAGVQKVLIREIAHLKGEHVKVNETEDRAGESKSQGESKRRRIE